MTSIMPYTPQESLDMVRALSAIVQELRTTEFKAEVDYGVIPGTSKPTLLLPGMEKLMRALRLRAEYVATEKMIDFENGIFFYEYECRLSEVETGLCVSTAIGSANSRETKWRWRNGERVCPNCGKETIIKGKEEYGGGWICFAKKGGCGSKFKDNDAAIIGQTVGRVENPDIADQANTICKIAQKRALASAIKCAANVSEFFTVDIEDMPRHSLGSFDAQPAASDNVVEGSFTPVVVEKPAQPKTRPPKPAPSTPAASDSTNPLDRGFSVETGRNFMGWCKRNYGLSEENVQKVIDTIAGRELAAITQFPGTIYDAIAGVMLMASKQDDNESFSDYLSNMQNVRTMGPHGKAFTSMDLSKIAGSADQMAKID